MAELGELNEAAADTQINTDTQDQNHHGETPYDAIDVIIDVGNHFYHNFSSFCAEKMGKKPIALFGFCKIYP